MMVLVSAVMGAAAAVVVGVGWPTGAAAGAASTAVDAGVF